MKENQGSSPAFEPGYYCYMVECSNGAFYTGWARDPHKRCKVHNQGKGARYTRMHRPVTLVYFERLDSIQDVMRREREIKRMDHAAKLKLTSAKND